MGKDRFFKVDEMFEMVSWTPNEEKFLVDQLIEFKSNGKLFRLGCQSDALNEIASQLTKAFGKTISYQKVVKKFNSLRTRYDLWENVALWPGVKVNIADDKCEATQSTWDVILKDHPSAKKYKNAPENLWVELSLIFGGIRTEKYQKRMNELIFGYGKLDAPPNVIIIDDEKNDVDTGVKDEQLCVGSISHMLPLSSPSVYDLSYGNERAFVGSSRVSTKMVRFDDDYDKENSRVSSVASSMWP